MNALENTGEHSQPDCRSDQPEVCQLPHYLHTETLNAYSYPLRAFAPLYLTMI
jgi:hypothetical protein